MKRVLLTSVCRPLGEKYGDAPSVGYELLFGQVTRAQGLFSPRATHVNFSLEYIAENLEAPTTVLQYPSHRELVRELRRGADVVGISFVLATFHRMKEAVALVRRHAPGATIVLGGYGTVLSDEALRPYGDHFCREEGVGFMRRLLGEPDRPMPYRHPLVISRLRVFGREASRTGMIFAGLGCPNGCDFCCTSHFFKRRHIRLLPTGRDIHDVIRRYLEVDPSLAFVILDEDFLLNRKRALEFRDAVVAAGVPLSIFAFASVKAISQYSMTEILEMGIDGLWIGYEGTRSGYAKQTGRPVQELLPDLKNHGISVLASMIVGLPYQTPEIIRQEFDGLMALEPDLGQFLIYGPTPGTPFYDQVAKEGTLRPMEPEKYYRQCTGFASMVRHPAMSAEEIEAAQRRCFEDDFRRLGPSILRVTDTRLRGYEVLRRSESPLLRKKAEVLAKEIRKAYPIFLAGRRLAPPEVRSRISDLEGRVHAALGKPSRTERLMSCAALGLASWTGLTIKLGLFQHPRLIRTKFRMPDESLLGRAWRRVRRRQAVLVDLSPEGAVHIRFHGRLALASAERFVVRVRKALERTERELVLDLTRLLEAERVAMAAIAEGLLSYRDRIRIVLPSADDRLGLTPVFAAYA